VSRFTEREGASERGSLQKERGRRFRKRERERERERESEEEGEAEEALSRERVCVPVKRESSLLTTYWSESTVSS